MSETTAAQQELEITITRIFDAPRELIFKAWIEPEHVAKWFGPAGFEIPRESVEIDPREGGSFSLRMVHPESGMEYSLRYEIVELRAPQLLVLKSEPMPEVGLHHPTLARIELAEDGGKTRLTLVDGPYSAEGGRGASRGWEAAFDKLAATLRP
jgi:uncharacterized protein YndB with AHSA1/START domain